MAATVEGIIERRELAIRDEYSSGLTNMVGMSVVRFGRVGGGGGFGGSCLFIGDFRKLHFSVHLCRYRSKNFDADNVVRDRPTT